MLDPGKLEPGRLELEATSPINLPPVATRSLIAATASFSSWVRPLSAFPGAVGAPGVLGTAGAAGTIGADAVWPGVH